MTVNILVPMAGLGSRFQKSGYTVPKQLIFAKDKQLLDISLNCINTIACDYKLIFIIRDEHVYNFKMDEILKEKYGQNIEVVVLDHLTRGSVESCLFAKDLINNDDPLVIHTLDIEFYPPLKIKDLVSMWSDGLILTFKSNSPNYSYAKVNDSGFVTRTAEKKVISPNACVGIYGFRSGKIFCEYAQKMIDKNLTTNGEYYISPLYNLLIDDGLKIKTREVDKMHVFGTPEEYKFYRDNVCNIFGEKPVALCSDHSGFQTKEKFKEILNGKNIKFVDFGTPVESDCNYSDYIRQAAFSIENKQCDYGFGFCRSGQGVNMCANKIKGIRSALIYNEGAMEMAIRHNCANFFAIPSSAVYEDLLPNFLRIALTTTFDGGRHQLRVSQLEQL